MNFLYKSVQIPGTPEYLIQSVERLQVRSTTNLKINNIHCTKKNKSL